MRGDFRAFPLGKASLHERTAGRTTCRSTSERVQSLDKVPSALCRYTEHPARITRRVLCVGLPDGDSCTCFRRKGPVRSDIVIRAHANQRADTFLTPAVALTVDHTGAYVAVFDTQRAGLSQSGPSSC